MYVHDQDARKWVTETIKSVAKDFGSKSHFIVDLLKQDDWSFVIKAHAMLEAALTEVLLEHLGEFRLKRLVERLPLSDGQIGKVAAAKDLGLLSDDHRKFIRWFSELRNDLVHRLENIHFSFERHVSKMDKNQKKSWTESIIWFVDDEALRDQWKMVVEEQPKTAICVALIQVVCECGLKSQEFKSRRKLRRVAEKTTKTLLRNIKPLSKTQTRSLVFPLSARRPAP